MNYFFLSQTPETPEIYFDLEKGVFNFTGRLIPTEVDEFWDPIFTLVKDIKSNKQITFRFDLDYLNISSSKKLLYFFYLLDGLDIPLSVEWLFEEGDEDMKEVGRDYEYMINIPFSFVEKKKI
jgi:hypothetical protein